MSKHAKSIIQSFLVCANDPNTFQFEQTGFSVELTHVDGHKFTVDVDGVTECDHVMRVPGKGMPRRSGRGFGDLYITFEVDFPDTLTDAQKNSIREILTDSPSSGDEL